MNESLVRLVQERARYACEYCGMPERCHPGTFEIEHIVARQHGGETVLANLAYSCLRCNRAKGPNLAGIDRNRSRSRLTPLFNPRRHRWSRHFRWDGPVLVGKTPIGRVTIQVMQINDPFRIELREGLISEREFPQS